MEQLAQIPSLVFPEKTEKAKKEEEDAEWTFLRDCGYVRAKYLSFDPNDISSMEDKHFLQHLAVLYFPSSQPRNWYEEAYCVLMREAVTKRLEEIV